MRTAVEGDGQLRRRREHKLRPHGPTRVSDSIRVSDAIRVSDRSELSESAIRVGAWPGTLTWGMLSGRALGAQLKPLSPSPAEPVLVR